jgi:hypothetical protein
VTRPTGDHLSALQLDGLALGALDDVGARRAEDHLAACVTCRQQADVLRASRDHFSASVLPRTLPALRARAAPWWSRRMTWIAAPVLAAAVALVMLRGGAPVDDLGSDDLRVKGDASLQIVARRGDRVGLVAAGDTLAAGDAIRFVVTTPRAGYLLIASIDGRGATSIYYPAAGVASAPVPAAARLELPGSIVLDDAPGPERMVALWSARPLPADAVTAALAAIGAGGAAAIRAAPPLGLGDVERSIVIEKATESATEQAPP